MKYFLVLLILIGLGFTIPQVFSINENLFSGAATFERLPVTISPNAEAKFEIKFQYTEGTYSLSNVTAIVDITPKGAASFVHFDAEPFDVYQNSIARIPVTISVDPDIEYEKIFLNISYVGTGINDVSFKSSWSDSIMFGVIPNEITEISLNDCSSVDLESAISGGVLQFVCHSSVTNSVRAVINADSNGTVTLEIPKFLLYSLTDSQCNVSNDFLVLVKGREVASEITDNENTNSVTVDFAKGITEIEIMGTTILPDPSPAQYCGIVEGYEKQFLAPLDQTDRGVKAEFIRCNVGLVLTQRIDGTPSCVKPESILKLIERGWAENGSSKISESNESSDVGLQVDVTGQQQVRRGTTHDITVDVTRDGNPVSDSLVIITIEDYGKDIIREFEGQTDDSGRFVFSWEIPKSFDDIETLLAYVDVTDDISAKTVLFKFQVYCLPGEPGCKIEGN